MAIDVLSRENCVPIIVGDEVDMANVAGVMTGGGKGEAHLMLTDTDGKTKKIALSAATTKNFMNNDYALLVSLTEDDQIASAYLSPINDSDKPMQELDEPEIKKLAEALVAGNFTLDFLR